MPYNAQGQWTGNVEGSISSEDAVKAGLGGAFTMITGDEGINYPGYVPTETYAPSQQSYYGYVSNTPLSGISTPNYKLNYGVTTPTNTNITAPTAQTAAYNWNNYGQAAPQYQGLMGGDYNRLEQALALPGMIQAQNAYNTASQDLNSAMTGRGLYGSSIMANQANQGLNREYMNALASTAANAAASRYGMQQTDLQNASQQAMQGWQGLLVESTAANQAGLDYSKLGTQTNLANAANALSAAQSNQQAGLDIYGKQMAQSEAANQYGLSQAAQQIAQNQAIYEANKSDAQRQQEYAQGKMEYENAGDEAYRDWQNEQAYNQYKYDVAAADYANKMNTQKLNAYLALAGYGAPLETATSNANSSNWSSLLAALASLYGSS